MHWRESYWVSCGKVDAAMELLRGALEWVNNPQAVEDLIGYLEKRRAFIPDTQERQRVGLWIASTRVEKFNDWAISARCKHRGMSWTPQGVLALAAIEARGGMGNWTVGERIANSPSECCRNRSGRWLELNYGRTNWRARGELLEALAFLVMQGGDRFAGLVRELREQSGQVFERMSSLLGLAQRRRERLDEGLQTRQQAVDQLGGHLRLSHHVPQPGVESLIHVRPRSEKYQRRKLISQIPLGRAKTAKQ